MEDLYRSTSADVFRLPGGGWCVRNTNLAWNLLRDPDFHEGPSGFFGPLLTSRQSQVEVGRAVRDFLRARMPECRDRLVAAVAGLPADSRWPEAATGLVHRALGDLLLAPDSPPELRRLAERAVRGGVIVRLSRVRQRAWAEVLRKRFLSALTEEVRRRLAAGAAVRGPRDMLDAVIRARPGSLTHRDTAVLYLMFFRAIVVPISSSVAWSVLLACVHGSSGPWPIDAVVRESSRHRPSVWMISRPVPAATDIAGITFRPGDLLSISPYLLHHDEQHWTDPGEFRPERWSEPGGRGPYIPFGAGPFICSGAAVAQELVVEVVTAVARNADMAVSSADTRPTVEEVAVPRPFTLHRTTRATRGSAFLEGGEAPWPRCDASSTASRPDVGTGTPAEN
ncbi:cytochrome P450 [Saccharopolyspora indica]|uniref:cytochrome P450 n=1 Tax=Saccharopolyspora indica TaxID=1229659 RepID=UPI0022EABA8E|nr:cytochrome P450 [Saccharopolyspora indica]MDA3648076.1 cytochrome P450 [Saccharopolyspora indica]